jgi:hypothetical protein
MMGDKAKQVGRKMDFYQLKADLLDVQLGPGSTKLVLVLKREMTLNTPQRGSDLFGGF